MNIRKIFVLFAIFFITAFPQSVKVIESNEFFIKIEYNFANSYQIKDTIIQNVNYSLVKGGGLTTRKPGEPWIPQVIANIGKKPGANLKIKLLEDKVKTFQGKLVLPIPEVSPYENQIDISTAFDKEVYSKNQLFPSYVADVKNSFLMRYINVDVLEVSPFQFNPVTRELLFHEKIVIQIDYNNSGYENSQSMNDPMTTEFIKHNLLNSSIALNWQAKTFTEKSASDSSWYDPSKKWYKIYVKEKDVYRVTYSQLASSGVNINPEIKAIEIYSGSTSIPILVKDMDKNNIFNEGDYIEFVGFPPPPSHYSKLNIYNNSNIYWLTLEGSLSPNHYSLVDENENNFEIQTNKSYELKHYEKDSIYERLGHAPNDQRDYWFWGKGSVSRGTILSAFEGRFKMLENFNADSMFLDVKVNLHGIMNFPGCSHTASIYLTDKLLGTSTWQGQLENNFEGRFKISENDYHLYPEGNRIRVEVKGENCGGDDEIRINWFELGYWKDLRAISNSININSFAENKRIRYWTFGWNVPQNDSVSIFVPSANKIIINPLIANDQYNSILFVDNAAGNSEYFCKISSNFRNVDSIIIDAPSNLKNNTAGSDYIIIAHKKFASIAEELKAFREINFPDTSITNPRIQIAYVDEIYDEFSGGLMDPYAIQKFCKFAFENYAAPAPDYVVLLGDMSYDYRELNKNNRKNYIPAIPFHTLTYGQSISDHLFVAVQGNDLSPEMAIGRISIEEVSEGRIILDKLKSYPGDNSKAWKQNILLMSGGLDEKDENNLGFNETSMRLENLIANPRGLQTSKVFRYPNKPEFEQYQGQAPEIRREFNDGAVIANYYGHGGGYQWDLTFSNSDIYELVNGARLPLITSVTCYTAHFDNQDVFGEQFIKVPDKGCIAFFGSSGLTSWYLSEYINEAIYNDLFIKGNSNIGKGILYGKLSQYGLSRLYNEQMVQLNLLGDPVMKLAVPEKPDYSVIAKDIVFSKENIVKGDSVDINIHLYNYGILTEDSVDIEITASSPDTSYVIEAKNIKSFGEGDNQIINWKPAKGGLYNIKVRIAESLAKELDLSDNEASSTIAVYDLNEPNIIKPTNGLVQADKKINFILSDISHYIGASFTYEIQIDTSLIMNSSSLINSGLINPSEGIAKWVSPDLNKGVYFWRTRTFDGSNYGFWSNIRSITIADSNHQGYYAHDNILKKFSSYNMNFNEESKSFILNSEELSAKPNNDRLLDSLIVDSTFAVTDTSSLTTITTDGTYIYFATLQYYAGTASNPQGNTRIHKIGTGNNGTEKGKYYGYVPNFYDKVVNQIFYHSDNFIYAANGSPDYLLRVDLATGNTDTTWVPKKIIRSYDGKTEPGGTYLTSDGKYVYNLAQGDSLGNKKNILRIFDPANNWNLLSEDKVLQGESYASNLSSFFVIDSLLYTHEYYYSNLMKRFNIPTGSFEEEWLTLVPMRLLYSWTYDFVNDKIYAANFRYSKPLVFKFESKYRDSKGTLTSEEIGPAQKWESISYVVANENSNTTFKGTLLGYNQENKNWESLGEIKDGMLNIDTLNAGIYSKVKADFNITNISSGDFEPLQFKSLDVKYDQQPDIYLSKNDISFNKDTLMQGFTTSLKINVRNISSIQTDSVDLKVYLNDADSAFYTHRFDKISADTMVSIDKEFNTDIFTPNFTHKFKVILSAKTKELFSYNNIGEKTFYVSRDSINPNFKVTFDGKEIINGDLVSSNPKIEISLKDNSPLALSSKNFKIVFDNVDLDLNKNEIDTSYIPYPNSEYKINWIPELDNGRHILDIIAEDASGNVFDSTSLKTVFYVENNFYLRNVYNYPNPFKSDTYFTFELTGDNDKFEKLQLKIYTVAGRLIKDIELPASQLKVGFNKLYWDGRDQDGDEISNGVYLYKITAFSEGKSKSVIQKLAKVK